MSEEKVLATGKVKWFDCKKGYGFIRADGTDYFMHYSSINLPEGKRYLFTNDVVEFEPAQNENGLCATNVTPILTLTMIRKALRKEGLYVQRFTNVYGHEAYHVIKNENNVIQAPKESLEEGLDFDELAKYAELA